MYGNVLTQIIPPQQAQISKNKKGRFAQVVFEILEYLADKNKCRVTPTESRMIWHLIRRTSGWNVELAQIMSREWAEATHTRSDHVHKALKGLLAKKIIIRVKEPGERTPYWGFNKDLFGRVLPDGGGEGSGRRARLKMVTVLENPGIKDSDLGSTKLPTSMISEPPIPPPFIPPKSSAVAASETPKHIKTQINISQDRETLKSVNQGKWEEVKGEILRNYQNDDKRLEKAKEHLTSEGRVHHIPAYILKAWQGIRGQYGFVERQIDLYVPESLPEPNLSLMRSYLPGILASLQS